MISLWENVSADNPPSPSSLLYAVSFARPCTALLELLALPSTTHDLQCTYKASAVKPGPCSFAQPDSLLSGQKLIGWSDSRASTVQC